MHFLITSCLILLACVVSSSQIRPNVTVLAVWASEGDYAYGYSTDVLLHEWQRYIREKYYNDPTFPFTINVELKDYRSDFGNLTTILENRLNSTTAMGLPPVSVVIGAEGSLGCQTGYIMKKYGVANVLTSSNPPNRFTPVLPPDMDTSFTVEAPPAFTMKTMLEKWIEVGVKTVATVSYRNPNDADYNFASCFQSVDEIGIPRGLKRLKHFDIFENATASTITGIVRQMKQLQPDAVIWCDWLSYLDYGTPDNIRFPMNYFKQENYLPKAISLFDAMPTNFTLTVIPTGVMDYVGQASFYSMSLTGQEYTEDTTPYANRFTPVKKIYNSYELLNYGTGGKSPSSCQLFGEWFSNATGSAPQYQSAGIWAALDTVEAAIYKVVTNKNLMSSSNGSVLAEDIAHELINGQCPGPYGRVIYDVNRVSTSTQPIMLQLQKGDTLPKVVSPNDQAKVEFIYPLPTWDERVYNWNLIKGSTTASAIGIAAACSFILLTVLITITVHRDQSDIKMLNFEHMASMCLACMIAIWGAVFLWQEDNTEAQCKSYLWLVYLPISYAVQLMNLKAYRLSVFLTSSDKKRLRKLNHHRVMMLTLITTSITAIILLIITLVAPLSRTLIIVDPVRPSLNYYECQSNTVASSLLYILVVGHLLFAIYCVFAVRNGSEAFRDGMVIKESFMIFWLLVLITLFMNVLNLDPGELYVIRTTLICLAVTLFVLRILISRCFRYWVPPKVIIMISSCISSIQNKFPKANDSEESSRYIVSSDDNDTSDGPTYSEEEVSDNSIDEMLVALQDPVRSKMLKEFAEKALVGENADFLLALIQFRENGYQYLSDASKDFSNNWKKCAEEVFKSYMKVGCDNEVNISAQTRKIFLAKMDEWEANKPIISISVAKEIISHTESDLLQKHKIFDKASKEISLMLYQNIWMKFRAHEVEIAMGTNNTSSFTATTSTVASSKKKPSYSHQESSSKSTNNLILPV